MKWIVALVAAILALLAGVYWLFLKPSDIESVMPHAVTPTLEPIGPQVSSATIPISFPVAKFDAAVPSSFTRSLEQLETRQSTAYIPLAIELRAMERAIEQIVPRTRSTSGGDRWMRFDASYSLSGERSAISVTGRDNALTASTNIAVRGHGDISFDYWIGSISVFSGDFRGAASIAVESLPTFGTDWRIIPRVRLGAAISSAKLGIELLGIPFPEASVRSWARDVVDPLFDELGAALESDLSTNDIVERLARDGWSGLCRSFQVSTNPDLWLEVKPKAIGATNPRMDDEHMTTELILRFEVRVVDRQTLPECEFPAMSQEESQDTGIEIFLPVQITYETLSEYISQVVMGKTYTREGYSVSFESVMVGPYGKSVLLHADIVARAPGWFGAPAKGVLYIVAEPRLDVARQKLAFVDLELDTSSRNALVALGFEISELIVARSIENIEIDLGPYLATLQEMAQSAFNEFASSIRGVSIESLEPDIRLTRIDVGRDYLRLVAEARGGLSIAVQSVPWLTPDYSSMSPENSLGSREK